MLLSVESLNTKDGTILDVWTVGGEHKYVRPPFQPYFYSLKPIGNCKKVRKRFLSDLEWYDVYQVFFKTTDLIDSYKIQREYANGKITKGTMENDILYKHRVGIDAGFHYPSDYPTLLAWDAESFTAGLSPNPYRDRFRSIATWPEWFKKGRREAIELFLKHVHEENPDLLVDFFGRFYDMPLLLSECKKLRIRPRLGRDGSTPYVISKQFQRRGRGKRENWIRIAGRVHFDVHRETDADYSLVRAGVKGGLNEISQHYGFDPITDVDHATIPEDRLEEVNVDDARCTYEVAKIYLQILYEIAEYLDVPLSMVVDRHPSHIPNFIYGRAYRKKEIISDGHNNERFSELFKMGKRAHQGAFNEVYETGIFHNIRHYDYASFYASIMVVFNLDPETVKLLEIKPYTGEYHFEDYGNYCIVEVPDKVEDQFERQVRCRIDLSFDSISRIKQKEIITKRKGLKKKEDDSKAYSQSIALKLVGNLCWGYHSMRYARWGSLPVGILIAAFGRYILENTIKTRNARIIQTSTDGWYETDSKDDELLDLHTILPDCFDLDFFKITKDDYDAMLSIDRKTYVLYEDGKAKKYGSGLLGKGHPPLEDRFIDDLCLALFQKKSPHDVMKAYHDLSRFPAKDFVMTFKVSKDPRRYHKTSMYASLMSQYFKRNVVVRAGDKIRYVKCLAPLSYVPLDFFRGELDHAYYKRRLATVSARILFEPAKTLLSFFDGQSRL